MCILHSLVDDRNLHIIPCKKRYELTYKIQCSETSVKNLIFYSRREATSTYYFIQTSAQCSSVRPSVQYAS